jgi:hypothetical protein
MANLKSDPIPWGVSVEIWGQLDRGGIVDNYNFSKNYVENLSNIGLELCAEIGLNGRETIGESIGKFGEKVNFFNLRFLKRKGEKEYLDKADLSWYFEQQIIHIYICFLMFNDKFRNNINKLDLESLNTEKNCTNHESHLAMFEILKSS